MTYLQYLEQFKDIDKSLYESALSLYRSIFETVSVDVNPKQAIPGAKVTTEPIDNSEYFDEKTAASPAVVAQSELAKQGCRRSINEPGRTSLGIMGNLQNSVDASATN